MKRLTIRNSDGSVSQPTTTTFEMVMYRLAAYEDTMPLERVQELAQADQAGRLVVLPEAAEEGGPVPDCFYNYDGGELCVGMAKSINDDEPTEKCKRCWYCESTRQEVDAAEP